jgi:hypothetical protein
LIKAIGQNNIIIKMTDTKGAFTEEIIEVTFKENIV